jgi:predicted HicB family RNase H-like nuclease
MNCDTDGREEKCFTTIVEKCEETKLERSRRRWEGNFKMRIKETG